VTVAEKGRAYLDMNCAHCHNPSGWSESANKGYDFRFETEINSTGILKNKDRIKKVTQNGEMPYFGTTVIDEEGIKLIVEYLNSL
jgi:mono/diheme cytochrome c family protein